MAGIGRSLATNTELTLWDLLQTTYSNFDELKGLKLLSSEDLLKRHKKKAGIHVLSPSFTPTFNVENAYDEPCRQFTWSVRVRFLLYR